MNNLDGKLISRTEENHTHVEWLRFLKQIDRETPKELNLHLIVDNYCTHKEENVRKWLARHPRFHMHFTPTSSSWLNLVERFFGEITQDVIRDGNPRIDPPNKLVDMGAYEFEYHGTVILLR